MIIINHEHDVDGECRAMIISVNGETKKVYDRDNYGHDFEARAEGYIDALTEQHPNLQWVYL